MIRFQEGNIIITFFFFCFWILYRVWWCDICVCVRVYFSLAAFPILIGNTDFSIYSKATCLFRSFITLKRFLLLLLLLFLFLFHSSNRYINCYSSLSLFLFLSFSIRPTHIERMCGGRMTCGWMFCMMKISE